MGASSSKPTTQSLPCTSLSFSPPVWPPPSLRLFPLRLMLDTAPDTPVPLLVDTLLPQLPMLLAQLPMPLPQLPMLPPLLSQLPMLLPSQLPPRSLSPSLPSLSPETTPLVLPAFTTPSPLLLPLSHLLVLVSPRLPPMAFPQSDRLPRLPSSRTSSSPLSSGDTRLPTKQSNFHNINQSQQVNQNIKHIKIQENDLLLYHNTNNMELTTLEKFGGHCILLVDTTHNHRGLCVTSFTTLGHKGDIFVTICDSFVRFFTLSCIHKKLVPVATPTPLL